MSASDLDKIFNPKSIAVIGASDKEGSVGHTLMKNLTQQGYKGEVYPINIRKDEILGIKAYKSLDQLPKTVDLAVIATPAKTVPGILEQCGKARTTGVIIISAGFKEIGAEGKALEDEILEIQEKYNLRIIGPNCLGIIRPSINLNATFRATLPPKSGSIAFISQSGAVGAAILDWATQENVGFSNFVSIGSMIDVDFGDLIDYFGTDIKTRSILMYIEGITNARKFMSAARHFARTKPIVVIKAGKFSESAKAAASHTGSLTGEDMVYEAAFKRVGLVRVDEVEELFYSTEVLSMQPLPKGPNLAIITNAGGLGIMATDTLMSRRGKLANLSQKTMETLNNTLPHYWSRGNPIDVLGDADADRYKTVVEACLNDENVDGLLIINIAVGDPIEIAKTIVEVCKKNPNNKTILTSFVGIQKEEEVNQILTQDNIPTFSTPEQAVKTYVYMYQYKRNLEMLYETPEELPAEIASPKMPLMAILKTVALEDREILTEEEAKAILVHCNIPVVRMQTARTAEEAAVLSSQMGYPVVLKILSPQITHKTDAGGVILDITNKTELEEAFDLIMKRTREYNPDADILGVTVQPMIKKEGYEVILGAKRDPIFGPVILFGMGGIGVEVFKDVAIGLPPLNQALARMIIEETKVYELLKGYRNKPPANLKLLEEILVRFSQMLVDFPQIKEIDINPLFINEREAYALDARIVIDKERVFARTKPYEHLVVSPYPTRYEDYLKLRNGKEVLLRPIKPEDEPLLLEMIQNLTEETKHYRFFQAIGETPHGIIGRYCNIDYDKEIAIVAELAEEDRRKIVGIARLITEAYRKTGEIALIVTDPLQGLGLGKKLVDNIIEICKDKNLQTIYAKMFSDDNRIIELMKDKGFVFENLKDDIVRAFLEIRG